MYRLPLKAAPIPHRKFLDLAVGAGLTILTINAFATAYEFLQYLTDAEQYWSDRLAEAETVANEARDKLAEIDAARRTADQ